MNLQATLCQLESDGNLRRIPAESPTGIVDLSTNDYLAIGADGEIVVGREVDYSRRRLGGNPPQVAVAFELTESCLKIHGLIMSSIEVARTVRSSSPMIYGGIM